MKSTILFVALSAIVAVSIYFTYQRSFVWKNFEIINSEDSIDQQNQEVDETTNSVPVPPAEE